ncbi:transcriptional regulator [Paenibacillus baekrokdamisoli]|uniref:Transcriptional regulator n=1 Tax=Paenibacillus baekrokdamisoli TaxID=1712516 RepID=A0A3G9INB7_9BACL|nr:response regulator [Paenibacillus baekrokdamisoli]MBB3067095.1 two-component system response regulator YcbB [Paenibacillus baekrokdamisoli]BBH19712.1 transcriptional regulator [Paenibacillus baekrokdamisoli]
MRFFITDDDQAIRSMLAQIIEDEDLGDIAGEAIDGVYVDSPLLAAKEVDILLIDLLMPLRDGIETVRHIAETFRGKIIMISQVESKDMVGSAYSLGIEYYITKPINRLEVIGVIQKVIERMKLQNSVQEIQRSLANLGIGQGMATSAHPLASKNILTPGNFLLSELGMIGEAGCKDLLDMLEELYAQDKENALDQGFPSLQLLFDRIAARKLGESTSQEILKKETKAAEQRVRRVIFQALKHLASLGLTDYSNAKFENYSSKFFEFTEVRKKMIEIEDDIDPRQSSVRLNIKKFIQVLYLEAKQLMG